MGDQKLEHLFDGFAIIHRYVIRDGEVQYQTRILDTDTWVRSCKANRLAVTQFGTFAYPDPCKSIFDKYGAAVAIMMVMIAMMMMVVVVVVMMMMMHDDNDDEDDDDPLLIGGLCPGQPV